MTSRCPAKIKHPFYSLPPLLSFAASAFACRCLSLSQSQKLTRTTVLMGIATTKKIQTFLLAASKAGVPGTPLKKFIPKNDETKVAGRKAMVIPAMPRIV